MSTTSTPLDADFAKQMITLLLNSIDEANRAYARMLWSLLQSFLIGHWLVVTGLLFVLFVASTFKAMMGRWGSLGSLFYNFFYFGMLYIIGLIWGPEVFVDNLFNAVCAVILYPICYLLSGWIMDKIGVHKRSRF